MYADYSVIFSSGNSISEIETEIVSGSGEYFSLA